ncbi:hypothetical protein SLS56_007529 [Neofusicoccum ribis]|uniref:SET domain-containing protein n=1 Tax=Neofusicoccum ribis TaxID=45134 RepID=A0ABR3SMR3_9PEZI
MGKKPTNSGLKPSPLSLERSGATISQPRDSLPTGLARQDQEQTDQAKDHDHHKDRQGFDRDAEKSSRDIQPRAAIEKPSATPKEPRQDFTNEGEPDRNTVVPHNTLSAMATFEEISYTPPGSPPAITTNGDIASDGDLRTEPQNLEDSKTYSVRELEVVFRERSKEIHEDREYFTKFRLGRARRCHRLPNANSPPASDSAKDFIAGPSVVPFEYQQLSFPWPNAKPIQTRGPIKSGEAKLRVQKTQEVFSHGNMHKSIRSTLNNPVDSYAIDTIPVPPYTSYISLKQNILADNHRTLMIYPYFDDYQDEDASKKSLWDELRSRYNIVADELRRRRLLQAEQSWQLRAYAEKFLDIVGCKMADILTYFLLPPETLVRLLEDEVQSHGAKYLQERREESCKEEFNRERKRWRKVLTNLPESTPGKLAGAAVFCPAWLSVFGFSFWHIARRSPLAQLPTPPTTLHLDKNTGSSEFAYRDFACRVCHLHNCPFHGAILEQPELSDVSDSDEESDMNGQSSRRGTRSPSQTAEVLDPVNKYNDSVARGKCCNVNVQRNVPKRTLLGQSEVQGFGLYMGEKVNAGDYLGEYKGEIVTKEEGSRRGAVYQHLKTNYLFDLNRAQEVDSTRAGNKLRFINNSAKSPNCEPRVMLCNTIVRIGMFATKDIKAGEELFFNYNYPEEVTQHFWEKGQKAGTAVAVRTKKSKPKAKPALSSDSEALSKRKTGKSGKAGPSQKAKEGRSRLGKSTLKGSSTINHFAWGSPGKRPRRDAQKEQQAWARLTQYLDDDATEGQAEAEESDAETPDEESSEDVEVEYPDSEEDERPKKRGRRAK